MAQSEINIDPKNDKVYNILVSSENSEKAGLLLKSYLDKVFSQPVVLLPKGEKNNSGISLIIDETLKQNTFSLESDDKNIFIIGQNEKLLQYGVYTLLEKWGFRKFTASVEYFPENTTFSFPKNSKQIHEPSFEYRALFYPDAFDESFREWHKLDWHPDDFGIWGHSFDILLPPKEHFEENPTFFALYENKRRPESLCMTNDTVVDLVAEKIAKIIAQRADAQFYSVSQNDDVIYCECQECTKINTEFGGPQGGLYHFLNRIAARFPETKFTTLAYLHTYNPPIHLKIEPNIYTLFSPIELDRGKLFKDNSSFKKTIENWNTTTSHLYLWDYTVQFSNYVSPFPNLHTFSENYKFLNKNQVKGLFVQGYADVPGDFSELRQYILAKLLWNVNIDIDEVTADFLRGFYGKAAPFVQNYLHLLTQNQLKANRFLDIYSGPVQSRNTFLTPEAMDQYDQLIEEAEMAVHDHVELKKRVAKLRLALEYVYFEQSKFYGKDQHGMFITDENGQKKVREGLTERVQNFVNQCNQFGIYELSEEGVSPNQYWKDWLEITQNTTTHLGENLEINFLTAPAEEFKGKGNYGLVDGNRGYKDFNINWIGWYGTDPEIEMKTNNLDFNCLTISFLEDQRHWVFPPKSISIFGWKNNRWKLIENREFSTLTENYTNKINTFEICSETFSMFTSIRILIQNQKELPYWRKRKNKKPMVMLDEIEVLKK